MQDGETSSETDSSQQANSGGDGDAVQSGVSPASQSEVTLASEINDESKPRGPPLSVKPNAVSNEISSGGTPEDAGEVRQAGDIGVSVTSPADETESP